MDADQIVMKSTGADRSRKMLGFQMMTNPIVQPYVDMEAVVNDFVIDEFADGDPDKYKRKGDVNELMSGIMGQPTGVPGQPSMPGAVPSPMGATSNTNINLPITS